MVWKCQSVQTWVGFRSPAAKTKKLAGGDVLIVASGIRGRGEPGDGGVLSRGHREADGRRQLVALEVSGSSIRWRGIVGGGWQRRRLVDLGRAIERDSGGRDRGHSRTLGLPPDKWAAATS